MCTHRCGPAQAVGGDGPFVVPSPRFVWVLKGGAGAERAFILVLDPGRVACPATARHQGLYHSVQYVL